MEKATHLLGGPGDLPGRTWVHSSEHVGRLGKVLGLGQLQWRWQTGLSLCKLSRVLHKVFGCSREWQGLNQLQRKAEVRLPGFGGWFMEKLLHSFLAAPPTVCSGDSQLPSKSLLYSGEAEATLRGCSCVLLLLLSQNRCHRSCE